MPLVEVCMQVYQVNSERLLESKYDLPALEKSYDEKSEP